MFRYESVNSTRKFAIVAEIVSLLKKIYKRDAPLRAVFKVKTLAVLSLAYPRETKHIPRNLNLPPFCRCLFLWKWCNPFPRARPCPTPEVPDSRTSRHSAHAQSQVRQIWLVLVSIYCVYKAIQKRNVVGPGQRSWFLVLTKRSAASGYENGFHATGCNWRTCAVAYSWEIYFRQPYQRQP